MLASATNPTRLLLTPAARPAPATVAKASSFTLPHAAETASSTTKQPAARRTETRDDQAQARAADRKDARTDRAANDRRDDAAAARDRPDDVDAGAKTKTATPREAQAKPDGTSEKEHAPTDKDEKGQAPGEPVAATTAGEAGANTALTAQPLLPPPVTSQDTTANAATSAEPGTAGGAAPIPVAATPAGPGAVDATGTAGSAGRSEKGQAVSPDLAAGFAQALAGATPATDLAAAAPGLVAGLPSPGTNIHAAAATTAPDTGQPVAQPPTPLGDVPIEVGMRALAGSNRFDIRLDPVELGRIDVRLEIDKKNSTVKAHLTVDRPETLALIQRDAGRLEQALSQAGLSADAGGINVSLRDAQQGGGQGGSSGDEGGSGHRSGSGPATGTDAEANAAASRPMRIRASGIDIRI